MAGVSAWFSTEHVGLNLLEVASFVQDGIRLVTLA